MKLHITNGDSTANMLNELTEIEGDVMCWRDVLHDGPVRQLTPVEYVNERAAFLADVLTTTDNAINLEEQQQAITAQFKHRQLCLNNITQYEEVILWFEHDLYDQLQLLEVLDNLTTYQNSSIVFSIISIAEFKGVSHFHGFGNLSLTQLASLWPSRIKLTKEHFNVAQKIWREFRQPSPLTLLNSANKNDELFPFLTKALYRFFAEYPDAKTGLTLTQSYILQAIATPAAELPYLAFLLGIKLPRLNDELTSNSDALTHYQNIISGAVTFKRIFLQLQDMEQAPFMGDLWIEKELHSLTTATIPLVSCTPDIKDKRGNVYALTQLGYDILHGNSHWLTYNDYNLWRGGVHITNNNLWFWQSDSGCFTQSL